MRMTVPLQGTLIRKTPPTGDAADFIRPVDGLLGKASWQLISIDWKTGTTELEVEILDMKDGAKTGDPPVKMSEGELQVIKATIINSVNSYQDGHKLKGL